MAQLFPRGLRCKGQAERPVGMDFDTLMEHAAQVPLVGRELEKSLLLLLRPYVRHKRCKPVLLYPGTVRYGSGHMADSSWHNPGLTEPYDFWDAEGLCLARWSKSREARVCLIM